MKHKKGTKVKIINTNDDTTHGFREGEIVTITNVDDGLGGSYRADSDGDFWWITDGECVALGEAPDMLDALKCIKDEAEKPSYVRDNEYILAKANVALGFTSQGKKKT
jgi:hypothetical protein